MDPKNVEFYKEGDYTPPAPFIEVASNPSEKNISLWLKYLDTKNKLAKRLQLKVSDYLKKNNQLNSPPPRFKRILSKKITSLKDPSRFRVRMYFESTCPHCKRMMNTLKSLQKDGFLVEAHQIDIENRVTTPFPIATTKANPIDVKKYNIQSVPFTLVADNKFKTISKPVLGFQSVNSIKNIMRVMKKNNNFAY